MPDGLQDRVVLVTGAAKRVGAAIAERLHGAGARVVIHYRGSGEAARERVGRLNDIRPHSATCVQADLLDTASLPGLVEAARDTWGRLDGLVNNASSFYPTEVGTATQEQWDDLVGSNMKAPFFLAQAAAPELRRRGGAIVSIVDVHGERPMKNHPIYCMAKAGLAMMTRSLARELGPEVRVNGVAPGAILWPSAGLSDEAKQTILDRTALKRPGDPDDIAGAVLFLMVAPYVTGQILAVDGGRSLNI
ncbi:MAG: pteridine reductase [Gammaproteobacteria bacterium]